MEFIDYYTTLEVPKTAGQGDIRKACRKPARNTFHTKVKRKVPLGTQSGTRIKLKGKRLSCL
ncbi:hypothetical protein ACQKCJ_13495 [Flavobacterium sp. NPDC079362]|uniref:hypothetical protein n=1 Tax=unclassified Flavobacterium TaxID=196869 RepID=UPI00353275D5